MFVFAAIALVLVTVIGAGFAALYSIIPLSILEHNDEHGRFARLGERDIPPSQGTPAAGVPTVGAPSYVGAG